MKKEKITLDKTVDIDLSKAPEVIEEAKEDISTKTIKELKEIAKEKGLDFAKNSNKEALINLIKESDEVKVNVISLENKPISPVVLTKEKEEIPKAFAAVQTKSKKNMIRFYNGRGYKIMDNGFAMWCDNGQSFILNSLK